jgi:hypothetical protein
MPRMRAIGHVDHRTHRLTRRLRFAPPPFGPGVVLIADLAACAVLQIERRLIVVAPDFHLGSIQMSA